MVFARAEIGGGNVPKDIGASFIDYCKKAKMLRYLIYELVYRIYKEYR
jgi:hypothetical protein